VERPPLGNVFKIMARKVRDKDYHREGGAAWPNLCEYTQEEEIRIPAINLCYEFNGSRILRIISKPDRGRDKKVSGSDLRTFLSMTCPGEY
jgi:hypothetical protein